MTEAEIEALRKIRDHLTEQRDNAAEKLRAWCAKVAENTNTDMATRPWETADGVFLAAAENGVFTQIIEAITKRLDNPDESNLTIKSLFEYTTREVLMRGSSPKRSTCASNNLIYACEGSAWDKARRHIELAKIRVES